MQARRQKATIAVAATLIAGAMIGIACGLDDAGTRVFPTGEDTSAPVDAAPVPRPDGATLDAAVDGDATAPAPTCPSTQGAMVLVDAGGLFFCIDRTEVTNAAYDAFLAATDGGSPSSPAVLDGGAGDGCAGNTTFTRAPGVGTDLATFPAARIDWCDAYAFCRWAGKRLCGKTVQGDAATGEWFAACSNGGTRTHAYGNGYEAGACNEDTTGLGVAQPVASFPGCEGGVPGLFDMNGNVSELIDNCNSVTCSVVGGYYYAPSTGCAVVQEVLKTTRGAEQGFRCCADTK